MLPFNVSIKAFALTLIFPLPVLYASLIPSKPSIVPPVGKSGPCVNSISSSIVISGLSINATVELIISVKLCGGIFVAIPTAIPSDPFTSKFGITVGKTVGSCKVSSKFGCQSTVSFSRSLNISAPNLVILASV